MNVFGIKTLKITQEDYDFIVKDAARLKRELIRLARTAPKSMGAPSPRTLLGKAHLMFSDKDLKLEIVADY